MGPQLQSSLKITGPNLFGPHFSVSLSNQTVWPVIFGITGPICARTFNQQIPRELSVVRASRLASYADNPSGIVGILRRHVQSLRFSLCLVYPPNLVS